MTRREPKPFRYMRYHTLFAFVGMLVLLLAGCGYFQPEPQPSANPPTSVPTTQQDSTEQPASTEQPDRTAQPAQVPDGPGGMLIMPLSSQDPPSIDPALIGDVTSAFVARQIFSGLVRLDNNLDVQPDLAESWEISDDGRTYTFTLHPDARFADGSPLTSEDVQYSLERATDPNLGPFLPAQTYLTDIVGVREKLAGEADTISGLEVIDEHTIALTIDAPKSFFLAKLTHPTSYIVDQEAIEQGGATWTDAPNGSGPFEIERWDHNQQLVLRRNLNFHRDLAKLDRVNFLIGASASNPMVLYEQDEIDLTSVPSYALDRVQDENNPLSQELVSVPQLSLTFVGMNTTMPPFDDIDVRRAFVQMLDRQKVAEVSLSGSVEPARGILPPGIPGYNTQLAEQPAPTADLEQAAELLEQSRYEGAENLPQIVAYGSGWTSTIGEIAEQEFDIDIDVRDYENFGDYFAALEENEFPLFSFGWVADYPDPENFLDVLFRTGSGENHLRYSNPEVDALLDQAATEEDEAARWELYQEIEQQILQDAPIIPIYHDVEHMLIKPYVRGLEVTPMGILDLSTVELVRG